MYSVWVFYIIAYFVATIYFLGLVPRNWCFKIEFVWLIMVNSSLKMFHKRLFNCYKICSKRTQIIGYLYKIYFKISCSVEISVVKKTLLCHHSQKSFQVSISHSNSAVFWLSRQTLIWVWFHTQNVLKEIVRYSFAYINFYRFE